MFRLHKKKKLGIVSAGTIAQVNEHNEPEATIDKKRQSCSVG